MNKYKQCVKSVRDKVDCLVKQANPNFTNWQKRQWALEVLSQELRAFGEEHGTYRASAMALCVNSYIKDLNNDITHHYISDDSLEQFLRTTLVKDTSILTDDNGTIDSIFVHTHNVGYCISKIISNSGVMIISVMANDRMATCKLDELPLLKKRDLEKYNDVCFAINLLYYMRAFPEKIIDGVPSDMIKSDRKEVTKKNQKSVIIGTSEKIVSKTVRNSDGTITPHFRSGFFRYYKDDRYVNMKGQVQFIESTMVKGHAKTVVA